MCARNFEINNSNAFASKMQVVVIISKLDILLAMNERLPCSVHDHPTIFCPYGVDFSEFVEEQVNMVTT